MKQIEASGARAPYEAPWAEVYDVAFGQSILISGSGTLPDALEGRGRGYLRTILLTLKIYSL